MTPRADGAGNTVVERLRGRLEAGYWPRLHCLLLVGLASATAFLLSVALLSLQVHSMAVRYGAAAVGGYCAFLLLIRAWVRWKGSHPMPEPDVDLVGVVADLPTYLPRRAADAAVDMFSDGHFGGGASAPTSSSSSSGGFSLDLDADDLVWVLIALAAALAGVTAIAYVIYVAPTLLAEAAVNAAVAGKVYSGMRKRDPRHWTIDVLRRTAVAALVLIVSAVLAGYALQRLAPEARSVGGVWQHLASR